MFTCGASLKESNLFRLDLNNRNESTVTMYRVLQKLGILQNCKCYIPIGHQ
jgi:hypothetical protein